MAEVTRRSVLMECLEYERDLWKLCSMNYDMRVPMRGMEQSFMEQKEKCGILTEMIRALENERVRAAMADWQKGVMARGPEALQVDGEQGVVLRE